MASAAGGTIGGVRLYLEVRYYASDFPGHVTAVLQRERDQRERLSLADSCIHRHRPESRQAPTPA